MGILNIDPNNVNLDDANYEEDDPDIIIHVRLLPWHIKFQKRKNLKKTISEELMRIALRLNRWWNFCMSEDEEKDFDLM